MPYQPIHAFKAGFKSLLVKILVKKPESNNKIGSNLCVL